MNYPKVFVGIVTCDIKKYAEAQIIKAKIKKKEKKCFFDGVIEEENFDPTDGRLYDLEIRYRDENKRNQNPNNIIFLCRRHRKAKLTPYMLFKGTGRVH